MKEGVKKKSSTKDLLSLLLFFSLLRLIQVLRTETARAANFSTQTICYSLFSGSPFARKTFQSMLSSF